MNINIIQINNKNKYYINKSNEPFVIVGEIIPTFIDGKWNYKEMLYDISTQKHYLNEEINAEEYINNINKVIFFACIDNKCIGQIVLRKNWNNYCFIEDISLAKNYRRKGIGKILIDKAQKWADYFGLAGLMLETQNNNILTCRFYLKQGFEIGSVDKLLYSGLGNDEYAIFFYRKTRKSTRTITVEDYNPKWADDFNRIKSYLMQYLKKDIICIEHVGSTSVKGLAAKSIIDIDIIIKREKLIQVKSLLEGAGYFYKGDLGIADRYNFKQYTEITNGFHVHNLFVCPEDSRVPISHLKFKDYLKANSKKRDAYSRIKKESASLFSHDYQGYNKHKEPFILECYREIFQNDIDLAYRCNGKIDVTEIDELRKKVGWNEMGNYYRNGLQNSYFYLCCFIDNMLVGFVDVISNGNSDAYIQDLIVDPEYQNKGIGTMLMNITIDKLKLDEIYIISVLFNEKLNSFFEKFGFSILNAGQLETKRT
ncbi:MAG: GNAT family N-acetyltransferase [Clostridiales bacterium]|nr:GNAT family N-acetyltransferase [Clostridiales bacterium]